jgi:hypothetical protein
MMLSPNRQSRAGGFMREIFTIGFSEDAFVAAVAGELATPGVTPLAAASSAFREACSPARQSHQDNGVNRPGVPTPIGELSY